MNISNQQSIIQPIQPIKPTEPTYGAGEVYEASNGNLVRNNQDEVVITPQGETNLNNAKEDKANTASAEAQDTQDDKTPSIIESLRDVQKQNNAVDAYATYQSNQDKVSLF